MSDNEPAVSTASPPIALVVDHYNRYPGELLTIYLRFVVPNLNGAKLQIAMPKVMKVESYELSSAPDALQPSVIEADEDLVVFIPLTEEFIVGQAYQITLGTRINTFYIDQFLIIQASLLDANLDVINAEELSVAVHGKGSYLKYLPEIYEADDFTSRFLMLFESYWKPVSNQIDQIDAYFDPMLTPSAFVPWLASWLGMELDDLLPLDRMRRMVQNAMTLSQCRGTLAALQKYLEIYTDGKVMITERRARNFVLGDGSLGVIIALGKKNLPNSVIINLSISQEELERTKYTQEMYRRKMVEIVRTQIPAHVSFDLNCEFLSKA